MAIRANSSTEKENDYLDEFTFRFNRRTSKSRGKLFYRLAQQTMQTDPAPFAKLVCVWQLTLGSSVYLVKLSLGLTSRM